MNCPYCSKHIPGFTGLQEAQNFQKHLNKCRKNPHNTITDGKATVQLGKRFDLLDAVKIRADSGQ
jgi:hypothetical protein